MFLVIINQESISFCQKKGKHSASPFILIIKYLSVTFGKTVFLPFAAQRDQIGNKCRCNGFRNIDLPIAEPILIPCSPPLR